MKYRFFVIVITLIIFIVSVGCASIELHPEGYQKNQLVIYRALKYYQIDFMLELADTTKPKVLCSGCRSRLANLEIGKLTTEKWEDDRTKIEILHSIEEQQSNYGVQNG